MTLTIRTGIKSFLYGYLKQIFKVYIVINTPTKQRVINPKMSIASIASIELLLKRWIQKYRVGIYPRYTVKGGIALIIMDSNNDFLNVILSKK